jgi:hypothetical protein
MTPNPGSPFFPAHGQTYPMHLFECETTLAWGGLDLPVMGMDTDWHGAALHPPLCFTVACDSTSLWFLATRQAPATCHPGAEPGSFTEGLWEHDVAELFLADPASGSYLEFNLAPNGAWWAAKFIAPRIRARNQPDFTPLITSHSENPSDEAWCAAIRVPLGLLEKEIGFGAETTANATAILNSPHQTFHSAHKLPGASPDFHQPASFTCLSRVRP